MRSCSVFGYFLDILSKSDQMSLKTAKLAATMKLMQIVCMSILLSRDRLLSRLSFFFLVFLSLLCFSLFSSRHLVCFLINFRNNAFFSQKMTNEVNKVNRMCTCVRGCVGWKKFPAMAWPAGPWPGTVRAARSWRRC